MQYSQVFGHRKHEFYFLTPFADDPHFAGSDSIVVDVVVVVNVKADDENEYGSLNCCPSETTTDNMDTDVHSLIRLAERM